MIHGNRSNHQPQRFTRTQYTARSALTTSSPTAGSPPPAARARPGHAASSRQVGCHPSAGGGRERAGFGGARSRWIARSGNDLFGGRGRRQDRVARMPGVVGTIADVLFAQAATAGGRGPRRGTAHTAVLARASGRIVTDAPSAGWRCRRRVKHPYLSLARKVTRREPMSKGRRMRSSLLPDRDCGLYAARHAEPRQSAPLNIVNFDRRK